MSSSSAAEKRPSDQEIVAQFNAMKQELQAIASKLGELEQEKDEHKMVVDTMDPLNGDRKCFRLINGVLVERTVGDVLPTLKQNMDNIDKIVQQLVSSYKKKEEDFMAFQSTGESPYSNSVVACTTLSQYIYLELSLRFEFIAVLEKSTQLVACSSKHRHLPVVQYVHKPLNVPATKDATDHAAGHGYDSACNEIWVVGFLIMRSGKK
ncbi:UNVERIFIED_CONTAM: hypothetical protein HDU68_004977 [Siphonaria sp. JEL0065]|nr:hypothetical protein HDU68_004977 [Siphonaria sp. JEL0065]